MSVVQVHSRISDFSVMFCFHSFIACGWRVYKQIEEGSMGEAKGRLKSIGEDGA